MQTGSAQLNCFAREKQECDQLQGQEGRRMNLSLPPTFLVLEQPGHHPHSVLKEG